MAKPVKPLTKFALTLSAAALGAGPLSTLPNEFILSILKSLLGDVVTGKLTDVINDVLGNLAGDYAKEFLDAIEKQPAQDLRLFYLLALQKALIDQRAA